MTLPDAPNPRRDWITLWCSILFGIAIAFGIVCWVIDCTRLEWERDAVVHGHGEYVPDAKGIPRFRWKP